jgi:8-oxo-dGTP diphosphatase
MDRLHKEPEQITLFYMNTPEEGKVYKRRVGAYGLIENNQGNLGIIKTSTGYFLPGGGVEEGEAFEESLRREFIEETGYRVDIEEQYATGSYFFYSTTLGYDMESYGHFYRCNILEKISDKIEEDHELVWLPANEAYEKLWLENQQEAVKLYVERYKPL